MNPILTSDVKDYLVKCCYLSNNRFAYQFDKTKQIPYDELKTENFTPTYDKWCLNCENKDCRLKCSICKYVYYCDKNCQKSSWKIHKKHCGRDLFQLCITCGNEDTLLTCEKCNFVKYCSQKCMDLLHHMHLEYDCKNF